MQSSFAMATADAHALAVTPHERGGTDFVPCAAQLAFATPVAPALMASAIPDWQLADVLMVVQTPEVRFTEPQDWPEVHWVGVYSSSTGVVHVTFGAPQVQPHVAASALS